jgi:hypothetical protein
MRNLRTAFSGISSSDKGLQPRAAFIMIGITLAALLALLHRTPEFAWDWINTFRPAILKAAAGQSPYEVAQFYSPPWLLLLLAPVAFIPAQVGWAMLTLLCIGSYAFLAYRFGAAPLTAGIFLLSPFVMHNLITGNVDWLVLLGLLLPPQYGLILLIIKPHMTLGIIVYLTYDIWRQRGFRALAKTYTPLMILTGISFAIFGLWPCKWEAQIDAPFNSAVWPQAIPLGMVLLYEAIRKRELPCAIAASPFFTPYLMFHSWVCALFIAMKSPARMFLLVVGAWIVVILQFFY